jgi:hypothetical protein
MTRTQSARRIYPGVDIRGDQPLKDGMRWMPGNGLSEIEPIVGTMPTSICPLASEGCAGTAGGPEAPFQPPPPG